MEEFKHKFGAYKFGAQIWNLGLRINSPYTRAEDGPLG
jgi:hypothetical protein